MTLDTDLLTAWEEYCDHLRSVGRVIAEKSPRTSLDLAEGYRYLARLVAMGIDRAFGNDPYAPMMRRSLDTNRKMYGDNPDALYSGCPLVPGGEYRISGTLGTAHMVVFSVMRARNLGTGESMFVGQYYGSQLETSGDGSFELFIGGPERPANWMPLAPDAATLTVRQAMGDWSTEQPGRFIIERIDSGGDHLSQLDPTTLVDSLKLAAATPALIPMWASEADAVRSRPNGFFLDAHAHQKQLGGVPGGEAALAYFVLEPNEALVIEVVPPRCWYWNLQICNYWYESLDYRRHLASINGRQAIEEADGTVRIVIAHDDPEVPNWLDTDRHAEGNLAWRWVEAESLPVPSARVVDLKEWKASLPVGARRISPSERRDQIAERRRAVDWRFVP